jgi:hypothetical protein
VLVSSSACGPALVMCLPCSALQAVKGRPMSLDEINLLYRVFDTNKDGFLEISGKGLEM